MQKNLEQRKEDSDWLKEYQLQKGQIANTINKPFGFIKKISYRDFLPPILVKAFLKAKRSIFKKESDGNDDSAINRIARKKFVHSIIGTYDGIQHEDVLIDLLLSFKQKGFYVEIGANDPSIFPSHTTRFYARGWTGINVEPQSEVFKGLIKAREKDINLNICVGATRGQMDFFEWKEKSNGSSLNSKIFTPELIGNKIIPIRMDIIPLAEIFEKHLGNKEIDFISIDVEGYELEVLMGNNWSKYRPQVLIIETGHRNYLKIVEYLKKVDYLLVYNGEVDSIFIDKNKFKNNPGLDPKNARIWYEGAEKIPPLIIETK